MQFALIRHPASVASIADNIEVHLEWHEHGRLWLRYHAEVVLDDLSLPAAVDHPGRRDALWRDTCFELFLRQPGQPCYYEFNFSPSRHWAAYRFDGTRAGRHDLDLPEPPTITLDIGDSHCTVETTLILPPSLSTTAFDVAIASIIRDRAGAISYWALAHPSGKPDFHHPGCFIAALPVPPRD